jgi:NTP pyrophosphatase (non-canonical NTP hydrolase)
MSWDDNYADFVHGRLNSEMDNFGIAGGLCGEAGEVIELFKKDKYHGVPLDPLKAVKEVGDALFYLTAIGNRLGYTLYDIAEANQKKLEARYPTGFVKGGGIREAIESLEVAIQVAQAAQSIPLLTVPRREGF